MNDQEKTRLLELHNSARERAGLPALSIVRKAELFAQDTANMDAKRGRLNHGDIRELLSGRTKQAAENIAAGQETPEAAMASWLSSPGHRRNLLGPYTGVGFGIAQGKRMRFWAAVFVG